MFMTLFYIQLTTKCNNLHDSSLVTIARVILSLEITIQIQYCFSLLFNYTKNPGKLAASTAGILKIWFFVGDSALQAF